MRAKNDFSLKSGFLAIGTCNELFESFHRPISNAGTVARLGEPAQ